MFKKLAKYFICYLLCGSLMACKPLMETGLFAGWFNQGTELVDGDYAPADHWQGRWRIINVWAEWCKPCWQEIPELNQFYALQDKKEVVLLGYNFDELEQEALLVLKEKMDIQFPVLTQWPESWQKPELKGLPATLIINPDNELVTVLWGPQTLSSLHLAMLEAEK